MANHVITKSDYTSGLQCQKKLWREIHTPKSVPAPDSDTLQRLEEGKQVGLSARVLYPTGVLVTAATRHQMLSLTDELIRSGVNVIFEPAFEFNGTYVRPDILKANGNGWDLIEVKASKDIKKHPEYVDDVAIQYYCLNGCGINIKRVLLKHLNDDCRYPDLSNLFVDTDVTETVLDKQPQVRATVEELKSALTDPEPVVQIGSRCEKPHGCPFKEECWKHVPENSIFEITNLRWDKKDDLIRQGILAVSDLPASFQLSAKQAELVSKMKVGKPSFDIQSIREELAGLTYPIYFFDFETVAPAIPKFAGCKPYEKLPFQYSCHILSKGGSLTHIEYLHPDTSDPRRLITEHFLNTLGTSGSIVVYFATFESGRITELADIFPDLRDDLVALLPRIWDQLDIFKEYYFHPQFKGSNSIKSVLPVIVPALSYDALQHVHNGTEAGAVWNKAICEHNQVIRDRYFHALREYCSLDTFAMVEIHRHLMCLIAVI